LKWPVCVAVCTSRMAIREAYIRLPHRQLGWVPMRSMPFTLLLYGATIEGAQSDISIHRTQPF